MEHGRVVREKKGVAPLAHTARGIASPFSLWVRLAMRQHTKSEFRLGTHLIHRRDS
jgi:hypothetical protein